MVQKLNYRFLFNSLISLLIIIGVVLFTQISMSNPDQFCITPEPGDSPYFGSSIVINKKYLAIGDPRANRVIIYTPDNYGQWIRTKKILPPADLDLTQEFSQFGYNLGLDGDVLTISAMTKNPESQIAHLPRRARTLARNSYWRYLADLRTETEVKLVDLPIEREKNLVRLNLLRQGKIEQIVLSDREEKRFAVDVALHQNLLLIGSPSYSHPGGAWLFDLNRLKAEPLRLVHPDAAFNTGTLDFAETVAISEQFAVVGRTGRHTLLEPPDLYTNVPQKSMGTLIKNLKNGSTTVIDSFGSLSLSGNILAVMRPEIVDGQFPLLQVFRLNEDATADLIIEREDIRRAMIQNGFLVAIKDIYDDFGDVETIIQIESLH